MKRYLVVAGLLIVIVVLAVAIRATLPGRKVITRETLVDAETDRLLHSATRIESFRVRSMRDVTLKSPNVAGYAILSASKVQYQEFSGRLAQALFTRYEGMEPVAGCFSPGVAFRLWSGDRYVDVLLCFHCNNMEIFTKAQEERKEMNDSPLIPIEASRPQLVQLTKEAFPDDQEIQSLPDQK